MSEHEQKPPEQEQAERGEETIEDLDVPEGQRGDVAGGLKVKMTDIIITG